MPVIDARTGLGESPLDLPGDNLDSATPALLHNYRRQLANLESKCSDSADYWELSGRVHRRLGIIAAARKCLSKAIALENDRITALAELGATYYDESDFEQSYQYFQTAARALLGRRDPATFNLLAEDVVFKFARAGVLSGRETEVIDFYTEVELKSRGLIAQIRKHQEDSRRRGIPPIFIVTMPKSGSMFILNKLACGLDAPQIYISIPGATRTIVPLRLAALSTGGVICQDHTNPTRDSLALLADAGVSRLVVHTRDPRQTMISEIHHELHFEETALNVGYDRMEETDTAQVLARIDGQIETQFRQIIEWLGGWMDVADREDFEISFTHFDDMKADSRRFFSDLLAFFGLGEDSFDWSALDAGPQRGKLHFRRGEVDEWRRLLSAQQKATAWSLIPKHMATRFGWSE